jgi:hypothetical protein
MLATFFELRGRLDLPPYLGAVFGRRPARAGVRRPAELDILGAAPDHPQRPDHPRSRYLKGALLSLDS